MDYYHSCRGRDVGVRSIQGVFHKRATKTTKLSIREDSYNSKLINYYKS